MSKENFAFQLGWSQVKNGDIPKIRKELMNALGVKTRAAFLNRMKGDVEALQNYFSENYGVSIEDMVK